MSVIKSINDSIWGLLHLVGPFHYVTVAPKTYLVNLRKYSLLKNELTIF